MTVKSESEVAQLCPTLSDPMDCSLPGSSIHGIFQARVLEWGAIAFSGQNSLKYLINKFRNSIKKNDKNYLPIEIIEKNFKDNIDIPENRFYKNFFSTVG